MVSSLARPRPIALQRRIVRNQARDLARLIPPFQRELVRVFGELGDRAAAAYRDVTRRRTIRQVDPGDAQFVDAITDSMRIKNWTQTRFEPAYRTQYLRTLTATSQTIDLAMGIGFNLPDEVGRRIISEGGLRVGLVDMQANTRTSLFHAMAEGRAQGLTREPLAAHIKSRVERGPWRTVEQRAQVIARTETAHAQRRSALETYGRMDTVAGVMAFDAQIGATDADCEERSGRIFSIADADIETGLEHPNGTLTWAPEIARGAPVPSTPPAPAIPPVLQGIQNAQAVRSAMLADDTGKAALARETQIQELRDRLYATPNRLERKAIVEQLGEQRAELAEANRRIRERYLYHNNPEPSRPSVVRKGVMNDAPEIDAALAELERMVTRLDDIEVTFIATRRGRVYQEARSRSSTIGEGRAGNVYVNRGNADVNAVIHEFSHTFEDARPGLYQKAVEHRTTRANGASPVRLKDADPTRTYRPEEITLPDEFIEAYDGKIYPDYVRGTELVSRGMEYMYASPARLARDDPRLFDFIFDEVLRA